MWETACVLESERGGARVIVWEGERWSGRVRRREKMREGWILTEG